MGSLPIALLVLVMVAMQPSAVHSQQNEESIDLCDRDVSTEYREAQEKFIAPMYKRFAKYTNYNFVISPLSIWMTLSAIAEGADDSVERQLFKELHLPEEKCVRELFYEIALGLQSPGPDVTFETDRVLLVKENVEINPEWAALTDELQLLGIITINTPFEPTDSLLNVTGNSALANVFSVEGLWETAFLEARVERAPFYDDEGTEIGNVDFMLLKEPKRIAHLPHFNAKAIALPVGENGRYIMLIVMALDNQSIKETVKIFPSSIIVDITEALKHNSSTVTEVGVPKFSMTTQLDARTVLEEIGVKSIWNDPAATMYVSDPPATPSGFLHSVTVNTGGLGSNPLGAPTIPETASDKFIANKPFMYFLIEDVTKSVVLGGVFSKPTDE